MPLRMPTMYRWLKAHWRALSVNGLVLSGFVFYCIFLSGSLFDRFEVTLDEAKLQSIQLPAESETLHVTIEQLKVGSRVAEVQGSAFIVGQTSDNSQTCLVLKSDRKCYVFDSMMQLRTDVTTACSALNVNLDWSGFLCNIPIRKISSGEYVIGVYVKKGDIDALRFADRILVKSESGSISTRLTTSSG
jgi:hypothetical protein